MNTMRTTKIAILAAGSWLAVDTLCWLAHIGDIRGIDENVGPNALHAFMLLLHWPGLMVTSAWLNLDGATSLMITELITLLQVFALVWVFTTVRRKAVHTVFEGQRV